MSERRVLGSSAFAKISAVEGIRPTDPAKLAAVVRTLRERAAVRDREIYRLRCRVIDLERVVARYMPDYRVEDASLPPRDKGAIMRAIDQYARRRARPR